MTESQIARGAFLLYAFPEPLPLSRARGIQVAHAVTSLASTGVTIDLAYVPVIGQSPLSPVVMGAVAGIDLLPISRSWPSPLNRIPPFSRWHSTKWFAARLKHELAVRRPAVVYVRHLKLADVLLAERALPPLIYEAHEVFFDTATPKNRARVAAMERRVLCRARAVVCNSQATADRLAVLYDVPQRLLVVSNGVARPELLSPKAWHDSARNVIYAGSFFGWKGVDDLVAAAADLEGFRISLVGGEPDQIDRIRMRLPPSGAEIELVARLPHNEVMTRLAEACIAVLPNRPDPDSAFTSPIKLFEYMAAGCAVVAADLPSIREILGNDEAIWFTSGDAKSLAVALQNIATNNHAEALGAVLREKSRAYTWQARAEKIKEFIFSSLG